MSDKQQQEINELKAMVNALRDSIQEVNSCAGLAGNLETAVVTADFVGMVNLSNATPKQCLANVKADILYEYSQELREQAK